jgi:hypothetical protein
VLIYSSGLVLRATAAGALPAIATSLECSVSGYFLHTTSCWCVAGKMLMNLAGKLLF